MKQFNIPAYYRSPVISRIKLAQKDRDPLRQDYSPVILDLGPVRILIARYFGFCYGVENAIEIAFKAISENPGKRIFLVSQMIHNPDVNKDLESRGVHFLMDTEGNQLIPFEELTKEDVVIIPAFGSTLQVLEKLKTIGAQLKQYDTTCPFVERVWNKSAKLGGEKFTVIIHGKAGHEETRATFSRSAQHAASLIVLDLGEAQKVSDRIEGKISNEEFLELFKGRISSGFDTNVHLERVGVINQTTMLASETQEIADHFREAMIRKYGKNDIKAHFADTRDTLCYATNQNQDSAYALLEENADLAVVVGGYNSSNTSHLAEICEKKLPSYFVSGEQELLSAEEIRHYDLHKKAVVTTSNWIPANKKVNIILTSGASCPDSVVEGVLQRLISFFPGAGSAEKASEFSR